MRNLSSGNKMRFTIFTFIVVSILVILVCAVVMVLGYEKEEYQVASSSFIYDNDYNYVDLENTAIISKKWTGNYYLKEDITKQEYKLGNYAISYDTNRTSTDLFGNFYQVLKGGNISKISGYNTINSSSEDKFYKIDDRKYLIIAKDIENDTGSLSTNNYLIVIIDRLGNALLLNNEINAKTINEMIIGTNDFEFDVANEILTFGKEEIDLKKIIGSTNQYTGVGENEVEENETEENNTVIIAGGSSTTTNNSTTNNSTTIIQNGSNINAGNINNSGTSDDKTWVDSLNGWIGNVSDAFENIYNGNKNENDKDNDTEFNKSITLNSVNAGTTFIDINYTINDPQNKYNVVYASVSDGVNNYNISLDKNANTYKLTGLTPDTNYNIQIGYKIIYSDSTSKNTIEDEIVTRTTKPVESINVTKVALDKVYYTLKLDSTFVYDNGAKIKVYIDGIEDESLGVTLSSSDLETAAGTGYVGSFIRPTDYNVGSSITIQLENTNYSGKQIKTDIKAKIINY